MNTSYWFNAQSFKNGNDHQFNLVWLFIIATSLIFIGLGLRDPWPADEPRFAQIAKEMVESGQWFFPMRGGELYPDKPPIFMWSIAVFYSLFRNLDIAFLLPSALCSLVTTFLVYDLGKRFWSPQVGWYGALLLLVTLQFTLQAKTAQIDAMVCCWITLGCYGLLRHFLENGNWRWYFIGCFFMGIGVITKGVGFLPILMLIPYIFVRKLQPQPQEINGSWQWLFGIFMLFGAILLWFIPMLLMVEHANNPLFEQYRDNILFKQTAKRYANSWHHIKPFWYYLVEVIPVLWLPMSLLLPWLIKHWRRAFQQQDRRIILPLCWIVLLLLFFSMSPGKRGVYILPALPMLAFITAPYLRQILQGKGVNLLILATVAVLSSLLLILGIGGMINLSFATKLAAKYPVTPWLFFFSIGLAGAISIVISLKTKRFVSWLLFIPSLWILYSTWGYQLLENVKTPKNVFAKIEQIMPNNGRLAIVGLREQFLLFTPYDTTHFGYHTPEKLQFPKAWQWQTAPTDYVLTYQQAQTPCYDMTKAIDVGKAHSRQWLLLPISAKLLTCSTPESVVHAFHYQPKVIEH